MNDFNIDKDKGIVSKRFSEFDISKFSSACNFIAELPYKRNQNKDNITCVFDDNGGTCSTKHAVLRKLALENNQENVKLMLGIFKMDAEYAPSIKNTLDKYQLKYIPEAHNYLKIDNQYFDFTKPNSSYKNFEQKILLETEIEYNQISSEKILLHKKYLEEWLVEKGIKYTLDEVWEIREKCIEDLQKQDVEKIKTNSSEEDFNCNSSPVCFQNSPEVRDEYKQ
ncbi:hypothetical protein [Chryseobacterium oryctis]|uniref:Uncharacterized protein n=1 Tax=Chryseobacterium oryctis TaxID=2952618 RepID=A0ABT3HS07_9FLAO|nr:hypothetical protein [Chryseobacterium oryctis]MCW3162403.1 hypothetical protein [Chryseobacterium oryctis]